MHTGRLMLIGALTAVVLVRGMVEARERPTPDMEELNKLLFPKRDQPNEAHARLMKLPEKERRAAFSLLLKESNEKCGVVTRTFFQGAASNGDAFWNVACSDGHAYSIQVDADKEGSTGVLDCAVFKALAGGKCFKKFDK